LASDFAAAYPFRHVVLDDVIAHDAGDALRRFPDAAWDGWQRYGDEYQRGKMICRDIEVIPDPFRAMIHELSEPSFLSFLERLTGIERLLVDPYLEGGGLHASGGGGILAPHTDFHVYARLDLYRRLNVLVYLNPGWKDEYGGCLELYEVGGDQPVKTIVPQWGRCVIFQTDDRSVHGFSKPVEGEGRYRRSIALYYYTSTEAENFSGDTNTYWKQHGELHGARRARFAVYRALLTGSRAFSYLAHRANPNLGSRVRAR
jgi:hypothetical protein